MRRIVALLAIPLLTACSEASTLDYDALSAWTPLPERTTPILCGDLLDAWADGTQEAPVSCWTFEETDGLESSFRTVADSLEETLGGTVEAAPACMHGSEISRVMSCNASWRVGDRVVTASSGVTISWLEQAVHADPPVEFADPATPAVHEVTLWIGDSAPPDDMDLFTELD